MKFLRICVALPIIFGTVVLMRFPPDHAQASDAPVRYEVASPLVRVALMRFERAKEVWVRADPGGYLTSTDGRVCDDGSHAWKVSVQGRDLRVSAERGRLSGIVRDGVVRLAGAEAETVVGVRLPDGVWKCFRGALEIGAVDGHLRVVNEVPLEAYLRGVVGGEMGAAPLEALKAQAVAARTYALHGIGKWAKDGYDLRDTSDSQVYTGIAGERSSVDQAIVATEGQILLWNGKPAATLFCADCGGATTPPTLPADFPLLAHDDEAHGTADKPSPPAWTLHYTPEQFAALLNKSDRARGTGTLDAVETTEADLSGRVRRLRVVWRKREQHQAEENNPNDPTTQRPNIPLRNPFGMGFQPPTLTPLDVPTEGLPTTAQVTMREITGNTLRSLLGLETLKSTLFTVSRAQSGEFVIIGRGYGHGKGMCQTGAIALAAKAFDYKAILNRYYAGAVPAYIVYSDAEIPTNTAVKTASSVRH